MKPPVTPEALYRALDRELARAPIDLAEAIAEIGDDFVASENIVLDYVKADGPKTVAEYRARRDEFTAVVAKLKERAAAGR